MVKLRIISYQDALSLAFWLKYWIAAYSHFMRNHSGLVIVSYEKICNDPAAELQHVAEAIESSNIDDFVALASEVGSPRAREVDLGSTDPSVLDEANRIYDRLVEIGL